MTWPDIFILSLGAILAFAASRAPGSGSTPLARMALALGTFVVWAAVAATWLSQPEDPWNAARLTPAVALLKGTGLYQPLDSGPVLSTVVGPSAFGFYLPVAWAGSSPTILILLASALNLACFFSIGAWLLRKADRLSRILRLSSRRA